MKRFCFQLLMFSIPFFTGIILLFVLPYDKQFGFERMEYDCRNGHWLYNRIYQHDAPIDVALLGSSRMMCAVSDYWMEGMLSEGQPSHLRVANLGFCRLGRSLHYALAKDLFRYHSPQYLIIEVREEEDRFSHIDFPYIADTEDILIPETMVHNRYFTDLIQSFQTRWQYHRHQWLNLPAQTDTVDAALLHSFIPTGHILHGPQAKAEEPFRPLIKFPEEGPERYMYQLRMRFPYAYLRKIANMVSTKQTRLVFLYLPRYHSSPLQLPGSMEVYQSLGEVWIPPDSIWQTSGNWADPVHMNEDGARAMTDWVAGKMKDSR